MDALKILVVDDESRMRKLVKDFLTKKNFQVLEAGNGEEAMDIFYEETQPVLGRAALQNIVKIILVGIIGSNHRSKDGDEHHDEKQNCADHDDLAAEHDPEHAGGRDTLQQTLLFCLVFHSSFLLLAGAARAAAALLH